MAGRTVDLTSLTDEDELEPSSASATFTFTDCGGELPIVFLCAQCRLPAGDSLAWSGWDSAERVICLKNITQNVIVDTERKVDTSSDSGCIYVLLTCSGCAMILGKKYVCTPIHLDFRRNLYCLYVQHITSYTFGSTGNNERLEEIREPITFETRTTILEELAKSQTVLNMMIERLAIVEEKLVSLQNEG
ncbi:protein Mis18-alpha [Callorhinchus milii]|uniref:protein Mis18-alpha n=1 Tax=Callorhinchus milii TaxID=7868 RepID=UPI0004571DB8|nr:protein Mis18-alpha [Callorhinchus milii]|eukprot:gi/632970600/ref/XP_007901742.1/ PREDICTED: protein Mis18-alpha [Callorhinchus milii]